MTISSDGFMVFPLNTDVLYRRDDEVKGARLTTRLQANHRRPQYRMLCTYNGPQDPSYVEVISRSLVNSFQTSFEPCSIVPKVGCLCKVQIMCISGKSC